MIKILILFLLVGILIFLYYYQKNILGDDSDDEVSVEAPQIRYYDNKKNKDKKGKDIFVETNESFSDMDSNNSYSNFTLSGLSTDSKKSFQSEGSFNSNLSSNSADSEFTLS